MCTRTLCCPCDVYHGGLGMLKDLQFTFSFDSYLSSPWDLQPKCLCVRCLQVEKETVHQNTRVGLPEGVVSTMPGPPLAKAHDRIQIKDTYLVPGQKLKFLTPPGIEPGSPGWKVRESIYHAKATDSTFYNKNNKLNK